MTTHTTSIDPPAWRNLDELVAAALTTRDHQHRRRLYADIQRRRDDSWVPDALTGEARLDWARKGDIAWLRAALDGMRADGREGTDRWYRTAITLALWVHGADDDLIPEKVSELFAARREARRHGGKMIRCDDLQPGQRIVPAGNMLVRITSTEPNDDGRTWTIRGIIADSPEPTYRVGDAWVRDRCHHTLTWRVIR